MEVPRECGEQCQFDCFCKLVLKHEAIDYLRELKRHRDRETAFASLSPQDQNILILRCVLDMTDEEIGPIVNLSRSAVQRHRTKALNKLRTKLVTLTPKGGKT